MRMVRVKGEKKTGCKRLPTCTLLPRAIPQRRPQTFLDRLCRRPRLSPHAFSPGLRGEQGFKQRRATVCLSASFAPSEGCTLHALRRDAQATVGKSAPGEERAFADGGAARGAHERPPRPVDRHLRAVSGVGFSDDDADALHHLATPWGASRAAFPTNARPHARLQPVTPASRLPARG